MAGLLAKERIVGGPDFNRWLVPPAALAIHLSIGMAYGFSIFWLPLSRAIGVTQPIACPASLGACLRASSTALTFARSHLPQSSTGRWFCGR